MGAELKMTPSLLLNVIKCTIISLILHHDGFWKTGAIWKGFGGYNEEFLKGQEVVTAESPLKGSTLAADILWCV